NARTFRISFPLQELSGAYTATFGPNAENAGPLDQFGNAMDTNLNAGVYVFNPARNPNPGASTPVTYNAAIPSGGVQIPKASPSPFLLSPMPVPDSYTIQGIAVQVNITHPDDPDLTAYLLPPGVSPVVPGTNPTTGGPNEPVLLFSGVGSGGTHANFQDT